LYSKQVDILVMVARLYRQLDPQPQPWEFSMPSPRAIAQCWSTTARFVPSKCAWASGSLGPRPGRL